MRHASTTKAIARWAEDFFQAGVTLTPEHHHYMQTTFATTDPAVILQDYVGCEIDSFLQMIFYPDQTLRMRYEHDWGETRFSTADVEAVMAQLGRSSLWGRVIPVPGGQAISIELHTDLLRSWLERLKIMWQPAPEIARHLSDIEDKHRQVLIRSHLRHAPIEWHCGQKALVVRFLAKMPPGADGYIACLSDLLSLLIEMGGSQAPASFFGDRKAILFQSLCKAETFEGRRQNQAMEVLMLQGCRAAFGTAAHWRRQMTKIDRLSRILYGNIPCIPSLDCRDEVLPQKAI
jgi:hypothetical protein